MWFALKVKGFGRNIKWQGQTSDDSNQKASCIRFRLTSVELYTCDKCRHVLLVCQEFHSEAYSEEFLFLIHFDRITMNIVEPNNHQLYQNRGRFLMYRHKDAPSTYGRWFHIRIISRENRWIWTGKNIWPIWTIFPPHRWFISTALCLPIKFRALFTPRLRFRWFRVLYKNQLSGSLAACFRLVDCKNRVFYWSVTSACQVAYPLSVRFSSSTF